VSKSELKMELDRRSGLQVKYQASDKPGKRQAGRFSRGLPVHRDTMIEDIRSLGGRRGIKACGKIH